MTKKIKYSDIFFAAKRFINNNQIKEVTFSSLSQAVEDNGYTVISFLPYADTKEVVDLLDALKLKKLAKNSNGFTYVDKEFKLVFINKSLSDIEKCIVLSHEIGHIACGHLSKSNLLGSSVIEEREASLFSTILLNYLRFKKYLFLSVIIFPIFVIFCSKKSK